MLAAGPRDRRITLKHAGAESGRDEFNAPILGAPFSVTVWAEYVPKSVSEGLASDEVAASRAALFRIGWDSQWSAVSPTWWLEFGGRIFDIVGAIEIGRREGIEITAAARAE